MSSLASVFTQLHALGLVQQEESQPPQPAASEDIHTEQPGREGLFSLNLEDIPIMGRASIKFWEERRANAILMRESVRMSLKTTEGINIGVINFQKEYERVDN